MKHKLVPQVVTLAAVLFLAATAHADMYGFDNITANSVADAAIGEAQLFVDVTSVSGQPGRVLFTFLNIGSSAASITDIYFDDANASGSPVLQDINSIVNGSGVSFSQFAKPSNLPGGNGLSPPFVTTTGFSFDSDSPVQADGVNPSESLGLVFDLRSGMSLTNVMAALNSGFLRIGIHVQGFDDGDSESFVNRLTPVPAPGAALLAATGLGLVGWIRRRYSEFLIG